jgi:hypothetical protein
MGSASPSHLDNFAISPTAIATPVTARKWDRRGSITVSATGMLICLRSAFKGNS